MEQNQIIRKIIKYNKTILKYRKKINIFQINPKIPVKEKILTENNHTNTHKKTNVINTYMINKSYFITRL